MALTLGIPYNTRRLVDAGLTTTVNFASGGNTANSNWINLFQPGATSAYWNQQNGTQTAGTNIAPQGPYVAIEKMLIGITTTASTNGNNASVANQTILIYLQTAPTLSNGAVDTGNIINMPLRLIPYGNLANGGNAATTIGPDFVVPNCQQYIRISCVSGTNVGLANDASATLSCYF